MIKRILIISAVVIVGLVAAFFMFGRYIYVVPVLMYHSIDNNYELTKLSVSPQSFEKQMAFLARHKYNVVGPDKLMDYVLKKEVPPPKTVAITFDDGFYNNYQYAFPVLKKYNIPATIFVIVNNVGMQGYLGWNEIKEMSDSGLVTIASHTMSHLWLPSMGDAVVKWDLKASKKKLEEITGKPVDFLCYPIGAHDERIKCLAMDAGYKAAFATNPGRFTPSDDVFAIKRVKISRTSDNLLVFAIEASGYYTWIKEHRDE